MSDTIGRILVGIDLVWLATWFSLNIWFVADATIENNYRDLLRGLLFHYSNTGGILYVLRTNTRQKILSWGASIPFLVALAADIEVSIACVVNLPYTHMGARIVCIAMGWIGVFLTVCGWTWFLVRKYNTVPTGPLYQPLKMHQTTQNKKLEI